MKLSSMNAWHKNLDLTSCQGYKKTLFTHWTQSKTCQSCSLGYIVQCCQSKGTDA
jgi:hypothetical protein